MPTPPDLSFIVPGRPRTKGSMKAIFRGRRTRLVEGNQYSTAWRREASMCAWMAYRGSPAFPEGAGFIVRMTCRFERPKSHYRRNLLQLKPSAPVLCNVAIGDVEKIARNLNDALEGIVWDNDAQIIESSTRKEWAVDGECSLVEIWCVPQTQVGDDDQAPAYHEAVRSQSDHRKI